MRARAFSRSSPKRANNPAMSPPATACRDIFSPAPGDKDVISHVDLLRPYVLGVKVAHPRDEIGGCFGVAEAEPQA